jgi:hypothetical protein
LHFGPGTLSQSCFALQQQLSHTEALSSANGRGSPRALPTPKLSHTDEQMVAATLALQQQLAHTDLQTVTAALASSNRSPTLTSKQPRRTIFARFFVR